MEKRDCQLQQYALDYGIDVTSFTEEKECLAIKKIPVIHFFFSYDPEKCIMCRRCARVCQLRQEEMYLVLLIVALKQK